MPLLELEPNRPTWILKSKCSLLATSLDTLACFLTEGPRPESNMSRVLYQWGSHSIPPFSGTLMTCPSCSSYIWTILSENVIEWMPLCELVTRVHGLLSSQPPYGPFCTQRSSPMTALPDHCWATAKVCLFILFFVFLSDEHLPKKILHLR